MKLGILAWKPGEAESVGIGAASQARGHDVTIFNIEDIGCRETPTGTCPTIGGADAAEFDAILSRAHVGYENWRASVERLALLSGVPGLLMLDPADAHIVAVSKFAMLHRLSLAEVPVPPTRTCHSVDDAARAARDWGPVVLKPSVGFRGIDVERFDHGFGPAECAQAETMLGKYGVLICQPFIPHHGDIRVLVIDGQTSICTRFHTGPKAWKPFPGNSVPTGAEWGVRIEVIEPPPELAAIGIRATAAMGLSYAGVDIVVSDGDPVVMEVNVVPGWGALPPDVRAVPDQAVAELIEQRLNDYRKSDGAATATVS